MGLRNIAWATTALTLLSILFLVWLYPSAQDLMPGNPYWNGIRDFIRQSKAETIGSLDGLGPPQNTVLITIPYAAYRDAESEWIKQFVLDGGTLSILGDFGQGNSLLKYLGVEAWFSSSPMLDPLFNFKNAELPRVIYFEGRLKDKGLNGILLNRPSALLQVESTSVLARSSEASFLDSNGNGTQDRDETLGPFPVAAEIAMGKGKIVLISDTGIVINSMIGRDDNYRFLQETLRLEGKLVIIDISHTPTPALDRAKRELDQTRKALSGRYTLTAVVFLTLVLALGPLWLQRNTEDVNGRRHQRT